VFLSLARRARQTLQRPYTLLVPRIGVKAGNGLSSPQSRQVRARGSTVCRIEPSHDATSNIYAKALPGDVSATDTP